MHPISDGTRSLLFRFRGDLRQRKSSSGSRNCGVEMDSNTDVLIASISELMEMFRDALLALIPVAERAKMNWRDTDTHIDWERMSSCAFMSFVRGPITSDLDWSSADAPLSSYDIDLDAYGETSWISVGGPSNLGLAMVRSLSLLEPFDSLQAVEVDLATGFPGKRRVVRWTEAEFCLVRRSFDGTLKCVTSITANE
jgi:hypothetical protein